MTVGIIGLRDLAELAQETMRGEADAFNRMISATRSLFPEKLWAKAYKLVYDYLAQFEQPEATLTGVTEYLESQQAAFLFLNATA